MARFNKKDEATIAASNLAHWLVYSTYVVVQVVQLRIAYIIERDKFRQLRDGDRHPSALLWIGKISCIKAIATLRSQLHYFSLYGNEE